MGLASNIKRMIAIKDERIEALETQVKELKAEKRVLRLGIDKAKERNATSLNLLAGLKEQLANAACVCEFTEDSRRTLERERSK